MAGQINRAIAVRVKAMTNVTPAGGAVGGPAPEDALATAGGGGSPAATGPAGGSTSRAEPDTPDPATGPAGESSLDLEKVQRVWPAVLDKLRESSPALAATFDGARPVSLDEDGLTIGFPGELTFNKKKAETPEKRELMADALEAMLGQRLRPDYVLLDVEAAPEPDPAAPEPEIDHDAMVEKLKSEFDAKEVG